MFTSLHQQLGKQPGPLTWDDIEKTVELQVSENDALDFKKALPMKNEKTWREEFAKDVAAMSNSGGGSIVFGIAEKRGIGTAESIEPVEMTEQQRLEMQRVAFSVISPPVMGLRFHDIATQDGIEHVIVLEIPPSIEVPHLVVQNQHFAAPMRHDAQTLWMKEREIEAAYRLRFQERNRQAKELEQLYDEQLEDIHLRGPLWIVAAARPMAQVPSRDLLIGQAEAALELASLISAKVREDGAGLLAGITSSPRIGYRRFLWAGSLASRDRKSESILSLHFDGSVTAAMRLGLLEEGSSPYEGGSTRAEAFLGDFAAMLYATARKFGATTEYSVTLGLDWKQDTIASLLKASDSGRFLYYGPDADTEMSKFRQISGTIETSRDSPALAGSTHSLAKDFLNQAGIRFPMLLWDEIYAKRKADLEW